MALSLAGGVQAGAPARCELPAALTSVAIERHGAARTASWVAALRPLVEGRRIVMLGEQSHGDGTAITARAEVLAVLHEHFAFDVLVLEADFFSLGRGWPRLGAADAVAGFARDNVYAFWAAVPAAEPLWRAVAGWKRAGRRFDVEGTDIRLGGRIAREELEPWLTSLAHAHDLRVSDAARAALRDLLARDLEPRSSAAEREAWFALLAALETRVARDSGDQALLVSLRHWGRWAWEHENRDLGMAENLRWLADHKYPGRRLVVWAHSNHIIRDARVWDGVVDGEAPRHLGNLFAQGREDELVVIGALGAGGAISWDAVPAALGWRPADPHPVRALPAPAPDSLEAALANGCSYPRLIPLARDGGIPVLASAIDHFFPKRMRYGLAYDALLYVGPTRGLATGAGGSVAP